MLYYICTLYVYEHALFVGEVNLILRYEHDEYSTNQKKTPNEHNHENYTLSNASFKKKYCLIICNILSDILPLTCNMSIVN